MLISLKRKIKNKLYNYIKYNEFSAIIAMIIMILIIVWSKYTGKRIELIDSESVQAMIFLENKSIILVR